MTAVQRWLEFGSKKYRGCSYNKTITTALETTTAWEQLQIVGPWYSHYSNLKTEMDNNRTTCHCQYHQMSMSAEPVLAPLGNLTSHVLTATTPVL
ncbi:hypothetical protein J6590_068027 [Homalodisca vitripennis]|nr:hypothetical protein J6590_068027 [Homalodisca vitripennis]